MVWVFWGFFEGIRINVSWTLQCPASALDILPHFYPCCLSGENNEVATGDLPFPCRHCLRRAGCQSHGAAGTRNACRQLSAERPCYCRVSYCSFSCPLTHIPSPRPRAKSCSDMSVFAKTHTQLQDEEMNCRYWGTSLLRSQSNYTREKKALVRRRTRRASLLRSHSGADRNSYYISIAVTHNIFFDSQKPPVILHWSRRASLGEGQPVNVQTAEGTEAVFRHRTHILFHEIAKRPFMGLD